MRDYKTYLILSAAAAAGAGKAINVQDFRNIVFSLATDGGGSANLTVKFAGSVQDVCPNFSAAQSVTNMFDYIEVVDLQSGAAIDGDTGVSVAAADDYRLFEANVNGLKWVCAIVTARSAGSVSVNAAVLSEC